MTDTVDGWDCTHANLSAPPVAQGAGYTTGSADVRWTDADWHARPGSVRICQDAGATDDTADVLDVETGAATPADVPGWHRRALDSWNSGKRPGQRRPAVYCSPDSIPAIAAELTAAKISAYPYLWEARWGLGLGGAREAVQAGVGPWHVVAIQYASGDRFDQDVYRKDWLDTVSTAPDPTPITTPPSWTEHLMSELPTLKQGDKSAGVRTLQGLLVARHYHLGTTGRLGDGIDGDFGALTDSAVRDLQDKSGQPVTGVVGPDTWPLLLAV